MKNSAKFQINELSPQDLIMLCNEKIICAARDLAEFTKYGLNAHFIVSLAHKCEEFENHINQKQIEAVDLVKLESELRDALIRICETGRKIWAQSPTKYNNYVIYRPFYGRPRHYTA